MANNFNVGVTISLVNNFSGPLQQCAQGITGMTSHMRGLNTAIGRFGAIQNQFNNIKNLGDDMMKGSIAALKEVIDPAKEYVHQLNLMNMAGVEHAQIQKNIKAAWSTQAAVPTSGLSQNLQALGDLRSIFGKDPKSMDESRELLPEFMRAQAILDGSAHQLNMHGKSSHDIVFAMAKAVEMMGKIRNPEDFKHQMDMMTRVMVATQGRIGPEQYQQMMKFSPMGKMLFDDNFKYKVAPELMLENLSKGGGGSNRVGTQAQALLRMGIQGIMSKVTATNLAQLGLLKDPVIKTTTTGTQVTGSGGIVGKDVLARNPVEWVNSVLVPAVKSKFPELKNDEKGLMVKLASVLKTPGLSTGFILEAYNKRRQFEKFGNTYDATPHSDELYKRSQQDPDQAFKAFDKSMETLKVSIGQHLLPVITPAILGFSDAIRKAGQFFEAHPIAGQIAIALTGAVGVAGAIISAGAVMAGTALALGAVGVTLAPFVAAVGGGIAAIAGITLAVMNWDKTMNFAKSVWNSAKAALVVFVDIFPGAKSWIQKLGEALKWFVNLVIKCVSAIMGSVGGLVKLAGDLAGMSPAGLMMKGFGALMGSKEVQDLQHKIAATSQSKDLDARFAGIFKNQNQHAPAPSVQSTTNVHPGAIVIHSNGNAKDIAKTVIEQLETYMTQAANSISTAGGNKTSWAHRGQH